MDAPETRNARKGRAAARALPQRSVASVADDLVPAWDETKSSASFDLEQLLRPLDVPLLFGKHEGCLLCTDEGFADAVAAFPDARTVSLPLTCCASPIFAGASRELCDQIAADD